jgi:hypothetical protein
LLKGHNPCGPKRAGGRVQGGLRRAEAGCGPGRCEQRQGAGRQVGCGPGRGRVWGRPRRAKVGCGPGRGRVRPVRAGPRRAGADGAALLRRGGDCAGGAATASALATAPAGWRLRRLRRRGGDCAGGAAFALAGQRPRQQGSEKLWLGGQWGHAAVKSETEADGRAQAGQRIASISGRMDAG